MLVEALLSLLEDDMPIFADSLAELRQAGEDEVADENDASEREVAAEELFGAGFHEHDIEEGDAHPKEDDGRRGGSCCRWIGCR